LMAPFAVDMPAQAWVHVHMDAAALRRRSQLYAARCCPYRRTLVGVGGMRVVTRQRSRSPGLGSQGNSQELPEPSTTSAGAKGLSCGRGQGWRRASKRTAAAAATAALAHRDKSGEEGMTSERMRSTTRRTS
jgi:hypothetical protein